MLLLLNVAFLILGMFLHSAAAIILVVPIVMPLVQAVGIDPVHFGLVVTLNLAIGQQTPPVASVLIAACAIAKSDIWADHQGQPAVHRRAGARAAAVHLCAVDLAGAGAFVLRRQLKFAAHDAPRPATIACILPNATSRGRYFMPQSGATTRRSAGT